MSKIGILDVDGFNYPNLALMKLAAWHKLQGDAVEWVIPLCTYDRVYMSKVFTFTQDFSTCVQSKEVIKGGTGYDLKNKLPSEIEKIYPDYSIYNLKNKAFGFLTRGCPRNCAFCIVSQKEGKQSIQVSDLGQFWSGEKEIKLLDPNLLACKDYKKLLQQLIDSKAWIDITQGLDARLLNEDNTYLIRQLKIKMLHFAWDNVSDEKAIIPKLLKFKKDTQFDFRKMRVYVLVNFNSSHEEDLYRIYKLKDMGYDPYLMIYDKKVAPVITKKMARWVNNKFIFRSCEKFEDYKIVR